MWCLDWQLQQEWEWVNDFQIQQRLESSYSPAGRGSPKLNDDVKKPKGKAPMPKDMWKLSPKPNPGKPCAGSGSVRCPAGRGGTLLLRERERERDHSDYSRLRELLQLLDLPWILLARTVATIEWDYFILINGRLANGAQLAIGTCQ